MDIRIIKKRTMFIFLFFTSISLCFSQNNEITKIKFVFGEEGIEKAIAVSCNVESFNELNKLDYKIIKEKSYINQFTDYFYYLEPDSSIHVIDARIMTIISYTNTERKDTLCFGEYHGIDLNGTFMKNDPKFLLFIKNSVWPRNVPDSIRLIPFYWELTPDEIEAFIKKRESLTY